MLAIESLFPLRPDHPSLIPSSPLKIEFVNAYLHCYSIKVWHTINQANSLFSYYRIFLKWTNVVNRYGPLRGSKHQFLGIYIKKREVKWCVSPKGRHSFSCELFPSEILDKLQRKQKPASFPNPQNTYRQDSYRHILFQELQHLWLQYVSVKQWPFSNFRHICILLWYCSNQHYKPFSNSPKYGFDENKRRWELGDANKNTLTQTGCLKLSS